MTYKTARLTLRFVYASLQLGGACAQHDAATSDASAPQAEADASADEVEPARDATLSPADAALASDAATEATTRPCLQLEAGLPDDLFCTGLYVGRDPAQIAADALPYVPGAVL